MPKRARERETERESDSSSMESSKFERERAWKSLSTHVARLLHHCAVYNDSPDIWLSRKLSLALRLPFSLSRSLHLKELWLGRLCTRLTRLCGLVNVGFAGHARRLLCLPSVYLVLSFGSVVLTGESLSSGLV